MHEIQRPKEGARCPGQFGPLGAIKRDQAVSGRGEHVKRMWERELVGYCGFTGLPSVTRVKPSMP